MSVALSIIGGVVSAIGSLAAAGAQARAAEYNAQVQERNRLVELNQADQEAQDKIRENRRVKGQIRAKYGMSNLELAGSPLDVLYDTAIEQELDVQRIRYAGEIRAIGRKDEATLYRMEAKAARTAGAISAVSGLLGGFRQAAGSSLMAV